MSYHKDYPTGMEHDIADAPIYAAEYAEKVVNMLNSEGDEWEYVVYYMPNHLHAKIRVLDVDKNSLGWL
jgi:hypothetical protein